MQIFPTVEKFIYGKLWPFFHDHPELRYGIKEQYIKDWEAFEFGEISWGSEKLQALLFDDILDWQSREWCSIAETGPEFTWALTSFNGKDFDTYYEEWEEFYDCTFFQSTDMTFISFEPLELIIIHHDGARVRIKQGMPDERFPHNQNNRQYLR